MIVGMPRNDNALSVALRSARLAPYRTTRNGNLGEALTLYEWNLDVSAALSAPLGVLEVTLRNRLDDALMALLDRDVAEWAMFRARLLAPPSF